jgi:hypothetical protein
MAPILSGRGIFTMPQSDCRASAPLAGGCSRSLTRSSEESLIVGLRFPVTLGDIKSPLFDRMSYVEIPTEPDIC